MIGMLETLANQIATLRASAEETGDENAKASMAYYAELFTQVLDHMAEGDGMLEGEMPWVKSFNDRGHTSQN
jgi:hypothetical protein